MTRREESEKVECCVLVADFEDDSYSYTVSPAKIEEAINVIKIGFTKLKSPCSRVYISGFILENASSLLTKEDLISRLAFQAKRRKKIFNR